MDWKCSQFRWKFNKKIMYNEYRGGDEGAEKELKVKIGMSSML